ncbi:thiol peroxidase [Pseudoalteromonas shioyasakiensis]|uniref:thiol peroxidase n=1 Tax=Pseudoalteromonas TaxID=53246 RepID=UPI000C9934DD|nr:MULTISPECIES: thiol peroxidase [Pseudoalteromonas]MAD02277.1 lipid hydroperoxide peroxidase [Pseudoalteromonas sp.]MCG9709314.1 thiol peroxidase [Pseudoalteromonas sp. Isolate3]MCP4585166.1 thiol peroxidase [Pseudoalteromonas sp.]MCQ8882642.1 thiol peroxidase [Pseudoalteromonas shioyasakiensis]NIZ04906.1 thiol peroxidase [Pseudoalteromonas sp. HF66]|tara:strand:- start:9203 stop:9784 length:582 start_codon:yes stop_codon:yes gene_type:complete
MLRPLIFALGAVCTFSYAGDLSENSLDAGKVSAQSKPVTLLGQGVEVGQKAPNFKVVDGSFTPVTLDNYQGQAVLLSVVPSLDTGVCSIQTKHFNEKVATEYPSVAMLTLSADLPFAQKRFCKAENIDKVVTLSDSVWRDFGKNYGLIIKDMGLLTRAVFVLDKEHNIVYKQLVDNLSKEPDYDGAIAALKKL